METNLLLESHLRQLRLPTFAKNYRAFATDAAQHQLDYPRYLLALAEQEVAKREQNMQQKRLKAAHFPVAKELADYDFSVVPSLNKAAILDLAWRLHSPAPVCTLAGQSGPGENSPRHRAGAFGLPARPQSSLLDCCRPGQ